MAPTRTKEVGVRLSVKDAEIAKRALAAFGADGQAALKRVENAAKPASVSIQALNTAMGAGRTLLSGFVTGSLAAVASAISLSAAIGQARAALDLFGEIADKADTAGVDAEFFQGIAQQAKLAGGDINSAGEALAFFARGAGLAAEGKGRLYTSLQVLNPELLRNIQLATSQEERVRMAAQALSEATSASERAALAAALFGGQGDIIARAFKDGADGIDAMMEKARALGIIVDRETIARAEELGDELDVAAQIVDLKLKQAFVNAAPALVWLVERAGDLATALNVVVDQFRDIEDRTMIKPLQNQLAENHNRRIPLGDEIKKLQGENWGLGDGLRANMVAEKQAEFDRLQAEAMRLLDRITELQGRGAPPPLELPEIDDSDLPVTDEAKRELKEAETLIERLRTATEAYGASIGDLQAKLGAGLITQQTFDRGQAEAALKFAKASDGSKDYAAALAALDQARATSSISERQYADAVDEMTERRLVAQNSWLAGVELGFMKIRQGANEVTTEVAGAVQGWANALGDQIGAVVRTGKFEWKDLVTTMLADIAKLVTQQTITRPLAGVLSSVVGSLFGGGAGNTAAGFLPGLGGIGRNADGTDFWRGGLSLVGERGPELLNLPRGSQVIPNHKLAGMGTSITLAPTYQINGSGLSESALLAVLEQNNRMLLDSVSNRVKHDISRGGWG